jgi:hypothetical protein
MKCLATKAQGDGRILATIETDEWEIARMTIFLEMFKPQFELSRTGLLMDEWLHTLKVIDEGMDLG